MSLFSRIHYAMLLQQTTATTSASNENNNRRKRMLDTEIFMPLYRKQQRRDFYFWQYAIAVKRIKAKTMCPHCCMECRQYTRTTPLMLDGIALHCKQFPIVLATQHHFHFFDCALGNCHPKLSQCCGCINFNGAYRGGWPELQFGDKWKWPCSRFYDVQRTNQRQRCAIAIYLFRSLVRRSIDRCNINTWPVWQVRLDIVHCSQFSPVFRAFPFSVFCFFIFFDFCRFLSLFFRNLYLRLLFELFHCIFVFFSQYILHIHCTSSNRQTYKKMSTIVFRFDLLCAMNVVQMHEKMLLSHIASHMWILCFCCRFVIVSESENIPISVNTLNYSLWVFLLARRFCRRIDSKNIYGTDTKSTESFILLLCFCCALVFVFHNMNCVRKS